MQIPRAHPYPKISVTVRRSFPPVFYLESFMKTQRSANGSNGYVHAHLRLVISKFLCHRYRVRGCYTFRRIKIEVNIGSTTIVFFDPFPPSGVVPPPVLRTMKPHRSSCANVRTCSRRREARSVGRGGGERGGII